MREERPRVRTTYLGQFSWERANAIAGRLEKAGIVWWYKQGGAFSRVFFSEWGVRLFVDASRFDEARAIAAAVPDPPPPGEGLRPEPEE